MKKLVGIFAFILCTTGVFAQKEKDVKHNKETNLLEATYYHENGEVSQEGTFDMAGKLHGEWVSYDATGEKVSMGNYHKGIRTGKWFFWTDGKIKEVEFSNNVIASVINRESAEGVADKN
ncbi:MAG: nicotinic acid mononucleotide adenyltransferase [Pricia sp.]